MHIHTFTKKDKEFLMVIKKVLGKDKDKHHIISEICLFMAGFSVGLHLYPNRNPGHKKILSYIENYFSKKYNKKIIAGEYWFIYKNIHSEELLSSYLRTKKNSPEYVKLYGLLMGYPKTACAAFAKDIKNPPEKAKYVLSFGSMRILYKAYPRLGIMNYIYSKRNWEAEYRETIAKEFFIINQLPEIFKKYHTTKNKKVLEEVVKNSQQKNLYQKISVELKNKFLSCESGKLNFNEQLKISE